MHTIINPRNENNMYSKSSLILLFIINLIAIPKPNATKTIIKFALMKNVNPNKMPISKHFHKIANIYTLQSLKMLEHKFRNLVRK